MSAHAIPEATLARLETSEVAFGMSVADLHELVRVYRAFQRTRQEPDPVTTNETEDRPAEGGDKALDREVVATILVGAAELLRHSGDRLTANQVDQARATVESLFAEVERLKAENANLLDDRDSWEQQAQDRVKDWDAMRQRAEKAEAERDALKTQLEELTATRAHRLDGEAMPLGYVDPDQVKDIERGAIMMGCYSERYGRTVPVYTHPPQPVAGDAVERAAKVLVNVFQCGSWEQEDEATREGYRMTAREVLAAAGTQPGDGKDAERLDFMASALRREAQIRLPEGVRDCWAWAITSAEPDLRAALDAAIASTKEPK